MFLVCTEEHLAISGPLSFTIDFDLLSQTCDLIQNALLLRVDLLKVSDRLLEVFDAGIDWE